MIKEKKKGWNKFYVESEIQCKIAMAIAKKAEQAIAIAS